MSARTAEKPATRKASTASLRRACGAVSGSRLIAAMIRSAGRDHAAVAVVGACTGVILGEEGVPPGGEGRLRSVRGLSAATGSRSCGGAARSGARDSLPGHHIRRFSSTLAVVTRYVRTRKVSSRTPTAMTNPSSTSPTIGSVVSTANVAASTTPAEAMTPPVVRSAVSAAASGSAPFTDSSRIRCIRKMP